MHAITLSRPLPPVLAGLAVGLAAILGAWAFQLIGGYVPCKLCLEQRIPYYIGLPILLGAALLHRAAPGPARSLAALGGLVFLVGAGLGTYQAGAEWGFWPGPNDCGGGVAPITNAGDLLAQMQATRLVSCTEASLRVLGLSFAGWNVVASLIVAALAFAGALAGRRRT
jgi:disulfide bond formation protein DsbB